MKKDFKEEYDKAYKKVKSILNLFVKRMYVIAFNIYTWYWLYREIFVRESTNFESYLLWFFTTVGMYYFVLENQDLFFRKKKN
ncbi:hypothetical protein GCM10011506_48040 [Marivirga lumbricoides]|uniref:2TM domain-containing protein n=1 Tax=Marivirga lumbricoides TaxID=1046115 RepID=A0ABQ1N7X5_9BACT|nr:hypothetical protein GCM10011506_48040 [Marivirga lumbricoides]